MVETAKEKTATKRERKNSEKKNNQMKNKEKRSHERWKPRDEETTKKTDECTVRREKNREIKVIRKGNQYM